MTQKISKKKTRQWRKQKGKYSDTYHLRHIDALKKDVEQGHSKSAFSLYELFSGRIEGLSAKQDSNLARKYLCASADLINKLYENDSKNIEEENKAMEKTKRKI